MTKLKLLILILFPLTYIAQTETTSSKKYEFGFNLYSLTDLKKGDSYFNEGKYKYDNQLFSGIFVKRHFNKDIIRVLFDYEQKAISQNHNGYPYFSQANGNYKGGEIRLGYERELSSKKLKPFFAVDACYKYSQEKGIASVYGDFVWYDNKPYFTVRNEYSIAVGAGFKYSFTKNICLTYEGNVQAGFYKSNNSLDEGLLLKYNPVRQIGISILF